MFPQVLIFLRYRISSVFNADIAPILSLECNISVCFFLQIEALRNRNRNTYRAICHYVSEISRCIGIILADIFRAGPFEKKLRLPSPLSKIIRYLYVYREKPGFTPFN
jgi:hypothetical protein